MECHEIESRVREHPRQAMFWGIGAGAVLAQLPLRWIAAGTLRLAVRLLKPALAAYGLFRLAEDCREGRSPWNLPR